MGFLGFGKKKEVEPTQESLTSIDVHKILTDFLQLALEYLNLCKTNLEADLEKELNTKESVNMSSELKKAADNFNRAFSYFTAKQDVFKKQGGQEFMAYRIIIPAIGPVYQEVNIYHAGNKINKVKVLQNIETALSALAEIRLETFKKREAKRAAA